jgi:hypothetical protein
MSYCRIPCSMSGMHFLFSLLLSCTLRGISGGRSLVERLKPHSRRKRAGFQNDIGSRPIPSSPVLPAPFIGHFIRFYTCMSIFNIIIRHNIIDTPRSFQKGVENLGMGFIKGNKNGGTQPFRDPKRITFDMHARVRGKGAKSSQAVFRPDFTPCGQFLRRRPSSWIEN